MKKIALVLLAVLSVSPVLASNTAKAATTVGNSETVTSNSNMKDDSVATPEWVVIEEDWFFPLRFEPYNALDSIRYHYRRNEEKAAANEIDKAISWLKLAADHAMPVTQEKLKDATQELAKVAADLRSGDLVSAEKLDGMLAKSAQALGEWHYYNAKEAWGKNETQDAGHNLQMAAQYLQRAADSAHYQFGPDTTKVVTTLFQHGKQSSEKVRYDHNTIAMELEQIGKSIKDLGQVMARK